MIGLSDRYIGRQVLHATFFTIVVLSLVLVLGNLFKEIRPLLVDQRAPLGLVFRFILHIIPFSLMFTIPWGFLAGILLVFGRLSSDNELHGFGMAGRGLFRLALPVFVLGAALSGVCWWLNVKVVPQARGSLEAMLYDALKRDPRALLNPGAVQAHFKKMKVFVERKEGDTLHGLHLYQIGSDDDEADVEDEPPTPAAYVHAGSATLVIDANQQDVRATLRDAYIETWRDDGTPEIAMSAQAEPWLFKAKPDIRKPRPSSMSSDEINRFLAENPQLNPRHRTTFRSEITQRHAFSLACFALAFIGVPLGINAQRKDTSSGLALSLLIAGAYFLFILLAGQVHGGSEPLIRVMLWAPNVLCIALGLLLFRRCRFR